jgi:hypothetical protein
MEDLDYLIKQKKEIEKKIKIKKIENSNHNDKGYVRRISNKLDKEINSILKIRYEKKLSELTKIKITELISRHNLFKKIKEDIVNYEE